MPASHLGQRAHRLYQEGTGNPPATGVGCVRRDELPNRLPVGRPEFYAGTVMTEVDGPNVRIVYGAQ